MGFVLAKSQASADHDGKVQTYSVDAAHATLLAPGDMVQVTGASDVNGVSGVDAAGTTGQVTGVIAGVDIQYAGENLTETGLPASTAGTVKVHIDPNINYIVDVVNGPLVAANVNLNANIVNTAASKLGGLTISNMALNATGVATTASLPLRIVGIPRNEVDGTLDGTKAIVRINNSALRAGTVGV